MEDDRNMPNRTSNMSEAEGKRGRTSAGGGAGQESAGITNRPLDEERENQNAVPERGDSREGAHAGHGNQGREGEEL